MLSTPPWSVMRSSLHRAVLENDVDKVEILINRGADVNCLDFFDESPLYYAVQMRNLAISKLLLIGGAEIESKLFISAVNSNHLDLVKLLLDYCVNPNDCLPFACWAGREDLVKFHIDHGADVNMKVSVPLRYRLLEDKKYDPTPLNLAVANVQLGTVKLLLEKGVDVELKSHMKRTALHAAVCMENPEDCDIGSSDGNDLIENKLEIVKLLIMYGCEVNIQDVDGNSPLHLAVDFKTSSPKRKIYSLAVLEILLGFGASVNTQNNYGYTPLHYTVCIEYPAITEILLKYRADPNIADNLGYTSFHKACQYTGLIKAKQKTFNISIIFYNGHKEIILIILDYGGNPNIQNRNGDTAFHIAVKSFRYEIDIEILSAILKRGGDPNIKNEEGNTPLHESCKKAHKESIIFILDNGGNPNIQNRERDTAFHIAVESFRDKLDNEFLSAILKRGGDPNIRNKEGNTLLHEACKNAHEQSIRSILDNGGNPNIQNRKGDTAFHVAVQSRSKLSNEILSDILKRGGDPYIKNKEGNTFLHEACKYENLQCIRFILDLGGNPNIQNTKGDTAFHIAVKSSEVLSAILKRGGDPNINNNEGNTPLHEACKKADQHSIRFILDNVKNPNIQNREGDTALHIAVKAFRNNEIFSALLEKGGDPNIKNKDGNTPLHIACRHAVQESIKFILDNGGNPNIQNRKGYTAFHFAVRSYKNKFDNKISSAILKKGGDPNITNKKGNTPLHEACVAENQETARFILDNGGNPNIQNRDGDTAFHVAIQSFSRHHINYGILSAIFKKGDPNIKNNKGNTPLHEACKKWSQGCIRFILAHGGNPNIQNRNGRTPLHCAVRSGDPCQGIKPLLEFGGNPNICDKNGNTCLHSYFTCRKLCKNCVFAILSSGGNPNLKNCKEDTPMHKLLDRSKGTEEIIFSLLDHGADFKIQNKKGYTLMNDHRSPELISSILVLRDCSDVHVYPEVLRGVHWDELKYLKNLTIGDINFTYYRFLTEPKQKLVEILRNKSIVDAMEKKEYSAIFLRYSRMIDWRYRQALLRTELIDSILKMSNVIFTHVPNLPFYCIEHILSFLSDVELRKLLFCSGSATKYDFSYSSCDFLL